MKRLTQTSDKGGVAFTFDLTISCEPNEAKKILKLAEKLKKYEDAEEQGLLLHLPFPLETECIYVVEKYGMKIYKLDAAKIEISKMQISKNILYEIDGFELVFQDFGEIAFLTQEEAEAKLKEMETT
nr:MAG TPA: hypothetical protein [Caudoviricetes sp.]